MKNFFLLFILLTNLGFAHSDAHRGIIQEELYVFGTDQTLIEAIEKHPELTIDHMDENGFELFGPKGTREWLGNITSNFVSLDRLKQSTQKNLSMVDYPSYEKVVANLRSYVAMNPKIAKMFSIGKSVQGRDLWVVKISDNVNTDEIEPEFKYISSMHGDEITGRELTQFLIRDLIAGYGKDQRVTKLINNTEIFIMPSMNPDGSKRRRRANANGYDLNRNFPDWVNGDDNTTNNRQPETKAVMAFQASRQFALSANFHGGAVCVNYPWDATKTRHPFDKLVQNLSLSYADENPAMRNSRSFNRGITNGWDWYELRGGMQDWSYYWHNDLQVTVELSKKKWPRYSNIPSFYRDNKESMLVYIEAIHQGGGFKLKNKESGTVKIYQKNRSGTLKSLGSYAFQKGEFYKYLAPGNYMFSVQVAGQNTAKTIDVTVSPVIKENGNYKKL